MTGAANEAVPHARERWLLVGLLVATAVTYLGTAARHVLGGDNGEFATLAAEGGVAHPPGYPLYTIYLRLTSWMPAASPAHRAALATALVGVAAVFALAAACRRWGASPFASTFASGVFAVSSLAWRLATQAEVFVPNALLAALILLVAAPGLRLRGTTRLVLLGLLAGLGLCDHHSIVLLAPVGLWAVARTLRRREAPPHALLLGVLALAAGLLPYAYTVWASRHAGGRWVWGDERHLAGLWHHFRRADYGTTQLAIARERPAPLLQLAVLGRHLAADLLLLPALLALAGGLRSVVRPGAFGGLRRGDAIALMATVLLAGPVFVSRFNIRPDGLGAHVVERFYLLPGLLLCVWLAFGVDGVRERTGERSAMWHLMFAGVLAAGVFRAYPCVREHHRPAVELYATNTLNSAAPRAVILGTGDHRLYAFLYAQRMLGVRRDVLYVDPMMLHYAWYRRRAGRAFGRPLVGPRDGSVDTVALAAQVLAAGRPLYLANVFNRAIVGTLPNYPIGTLVRVLPRGAPSPDPFTLEAMNLDVATHFVREPSPPDDPSSWAGELQDAYARPWFALARVFALAGLHDRAERDRALGRREVPWATARP